MRNSLSKNLAKVIIEGVKIFLKFRFPKLNLTDELLYKTYYELQKFMERSNIDELANKEEFVDTMIIVLKTVEGFIDDQEKKDPEYVDKLIKKHSWLWDLYKVFSDFVTSKNVKKVKDSQVSQEINRQINETIINDRKLLDYKVHRDVDYALEDIKDHLPSDPNIGFTFDSDDLRIRAPWVQDND